MATSPAPASAPRRRRRGFPRWAPAALLGSAVVIVLVLIGWVGWLVTTGLQALGAEPPGVGTTIVAPEESKAAKAAASGTLSTVEQAAAEYLAGRPTAYWLTPEIDPVGEVGARVLALAAEARKQSAALALVVYGLPERDCGNHSAGGLDDDDYDVWTAQIGQALDSIKDVQKIVVLEPDSLALAPECGNVAERTAQLHDAVDRLAGVDTWIYLDGGHSSWLSAGEMADLIRRVDASDARGFALNVSNYNPTSAEFAYAHEIAQILGGGHALIDTSRNGAGATSDWCNPPGRLVGDAGGTYGDDVVDTNLWIKPPGESDGECHGGPPAGAWWPAASVELTRDVR
ncbi:glycoside hydrolase family 6 protein [Microbacterium caowuchunii]|uniref:Glucanase n=1 Tax=Microbacterium caowuchunii TaxID=2614638 RepID=A0A5N0TID4_9MICO|nr:glycoside hydrolase family 6 protein [Microbacterium caowuchunii]KAA9133867.1 glycoside hydrolase family 6 protein [Microbacterium caowuchunii]